MRTRYTIELVVDVEHDDTAKRDILKDILRNAAQELQAAAVMVCEKRKPSVAVQSENSWDGTEEIELWTNPEG